jgi:hypothetical protein
MRVSSVFSFITMKSKKNDNRPATGFSLGTMMATSLAIRFSLHTRKGEGRKGEIGIGVNEKVDQGIRREKVLHNPDAQHSESQNCIANTI